MVTKPKTEPGARPGAAANEATRLRRLREDALRPISVNLAETISLSHQLINLSATAEPR